MQSELLHTNALEAPCRPTSFVMKGDMSGKVAMVEPNGSVEDALLLPKQALCAPRVDPSGLHDGAISG